jgi:hypothetical protein
MMEFGSSASDIGIGFGLGGWARTSMCVCFTSFVLDSPMSLADEGG